MKEAEFDQIGTAELVGVFENQSPEWLEARSKNNAIGGSDVATICGCNPWESAYTWWAKRTGRIDADFPRSDAMEWGTRLESAILGKFVDDHPEFKVYPSPGTFRHRERHWQVANPDAIFEFYNEDPSKGEDQDVRGYGIVEVKTAQYEDDWKDGVPAYYRTQVQWYLQTFGFEVAYVVVLVRGNRYKEYEVKADEFEQATNLEQVIAFREFLTSDAEPPFSSPFVSTYESVREQHPEIDANGAVELGALGNEYLDAVSNVQAAEEHLSKVKSEVQNRMGNAKKGLLDGEWLVTRQARNGGTPYLVTKKG